ncbi:MAG TPA: TolC family protein, partial [Giesbergeria sp.]|nr:TolC family protein [Giesbergeria sp.]
MPDHTPRRLWWAICLPLVLAACATQAPPPQVDAPTPTAWQAPLPHQGSVQVLGDWWAQWGDPLLVELVQDAQALSPDLAQAQSRIVQARAALTGSRAALAPSVDAQASASRGFNESVRAVASTAQAGLQAQWE